VKHGTYAEALPQPSIERTARPTRLPTPAPGTATNVPDPSSTDMPEGMWTPIF